MGDKRILIREIKPDCKYSIMHETTAGGHSWIDCLCCNPSIINTNRKCDDKRIEKCKYKDLIGLSRQEAIERMAMAMFEWQRPGSGGDVPIEDVWQNEKCGFENLAEAALNALLEVEK